MYRNREGLWKRLAAIVLICCMVTLGLPEAVMAEAVTNDPEILADDADAQDDAVADDATENAEITEEDPAGGEEEPADEDVSQNDEGLSGDDEAIPADDENSDLEDEADEDTLAEEPSDDEIVLNAVPGWTSEDGNYRYYTSASEYLKSGFHSVNGRTYYFNSKGYIYTGWHTIHSKIYYFKETGDPGKIGRMFTGWHSINKSLYYFRESDVDQGAALRGLHSIGGKLFYFEKTGKAGTAGKMVTGWVTINKEIYRFQTTGAVGKRGQAATGWKRLGKNYFYFKSSGKMVTGWKKIGGYKYYFRKSGGDGVKGRRFTGMRTLGGQKYFFDKNGHLLSSHKRTIKNIVMNAMTPMGSTLYIWGGGHDSWSGGDGVRVGVNPYWKTFFNSQNASYDFSKYRYNSSGEYNYGWGLDCSGFVGWVTYNTMHKSSNLKGMTYSSGEYGKEYSKRGWGTSVTGFSSPSFRCGDIVGYSGHVWYVLGKASDGSYVIMHASPAGVKLAGTVNPSNGNTNSKAVRLAKAYMKKYFGSYYYKLSKDNYIGGYSYLKGSSLYRFRWTIGGSGKVSDPDGYTNMSAEEILKDIFCE